MDVNVPLGPTFEEDEYPNHARRGKAIIFNHIFEGIDVWERPGSVYDGIRLKEELTPLGFEVDELKDPTYEEVTKKLKETANEDHSEADCLVVVVMSHGGQIHPEQKKTAAKRSTGAYYPDEKFSLQLIAALDQDYDEKELFIPFEGDKCVSLLNKPKIFFIQACRADRTAGNVNVCRFYQSSSQRDGSSTDSEFIMCTVPKSADFLVFRATVDNALAYKDPTGSWFIQALCDELGRNRTRGDAVLDLESLLLRVKRNFVARQNLKNLEKRITPVEINEEAKKRSQMPCVYSTLLRKICWKPKKLVKKSDAK